MKKDFIKYFISLFIEIIIISIILIIHSLLTKNNIFSSDNLTLLGFGILITIVVSLLFLFQLTIEQFLQFEIFTYVLIVIGGIFLIYGVINLKEEIFPCVIGISLETSCLFSRIVLWKYDKSVLNKEKK